VCEHSTVAKCICTDTLTHETSTASDSHINSNPSKLACQAAPWCLHLSSNFDRYVRSGHHMLPVALGCQDAPTLDRLVSETTLLHEDHDRDAGDTLIMAFDRGTFTKVRLTLHHHVLHSRLMPIMPNTPASYFNTPAPCLTHCLQSMITGAGSTRCGYRSSLMSHTVCH